MYVRPQARGTGLGRQLLAAIERHAATLGVQRIVLEAGPQQPEAIALYERAGYRPIPCFGAYTDAPLSRCYARQLEQVAR